MLELGSGNRIMKRALKFRNLLLVFTIIFLAAFLIQYNQTMIQNGRTNIPGELYKIHILGGFSVDTPEKTTKAAADGVQVVFTYDRPPSASGKLGQKLQSLHMKVVDGYISSLLSGYECHRTKTVKPPPSGQKQYCQDDNYPDFTDENVVLASVAAHLKQVKDNQLVIAYWVLDDWVPWDAGSARQLLIKIHQLIQEYTLGRPAICGFEGDLWPNQAYGWGDGGWLADNFSPQGCDMVGLYVFASTIPDTVPTLSPDAYDWTMSAVLPAMFAGLQQRGWNIKKEPLIGIGQAFGGPIAHTDRYWVTPNAKDIEMQSRSFCEHGAAGLTFYAWNDSGFGPTTQTPMNSPEIESGIRNGIAACEQYWNKHP